MKKSDREKLDLVVCPVCGSEYFPAEIYVPDSFVGKPIDVIRDKDGRIDSYFGKSMDLKESYICDKCGTKFNVTASVKFKTVADVSSDFTKDYTTKLFDNRIYINEDNIVGSV